MAKKLSPGARQVRELAEAANRRGLHTERDLIMEVSAILAAAKWDVLDLARLQRQRFGGDILAARTELGQERRYAIDCILEVSSEKVRERLSAFRSYVRQSKQPFAEFDEFWIVGYKVADPMRRNPENDRHFRVLELEELRKLLATPKPKRPRTGKATTKIGQAIVANDNQIVLAIEALNLQIEDKIAVLKADLPNSEEAKAKKEASISEFEAMSTELERIKVAVQQFKKNEVKEKEVVQTVTTFKETLGKWWHKSHDAILSSTSNSALFIGATGLLHAVSADSGAALAIVGSLIGGETVVKALKALPRSLFRKEH